MIALSMAALCGYAVATPEPVIRTVEIAMPVDDPECPRRALESLGSSPDYPDNAEAIQSAASIFERVQLLLAARALRIAREAALTAALEACAR